MASFDGENPSLLEETIEEESDKIQPHKNRVRAIDVTFLKILNPWGKRQFIPGVWGFLPLHSAVLE